MGEETQIHKRELEADPRTEVKTDTSTKRKTASTLTPRRWRSARPEASTRSPSGENATVQNSLERKKELKPRSKRDYKVTVQWKLPRLWLTPSYSSAQGWGRYNQTTAQEHLPCRYHVPRRCCHRGEGSPPRPSWRQARPDENKPQRGAILFSVSFLLNRCFLGTTDSCFNLPC